MKQQIIFITLLTLFVGCASKAEKEERRQNAFDLAGTYTSKVEDTSEIEMMLEIANEKGRHDIVVALNRATTMTAKERSFLTQNSINVIDVERFFGDSFTLGKGKSNSLRGGENISDDFGESSKMNVCSEKLEFAKTDQTTNIYYCLSGSIKKSNYVLTGTLVMHLSRRTVTRDETGKETSTYENTSSKPLHFVGKTENTFYTQFYGEWTGQTYMDTSLQNGHINVTNFKIEKKSENIFRVVPANQKINYQGSSFEYVSSNFYIEKLKDNEIPLIEIYYKNSNNDRLTVFGQIYSLGNLSGSIVIEPKGDVPVQIGSINFKKR